MSEKAKKFPMDFLRAAAHAAIDRMPEMVPMTTLTPNLWSVVVVGGIDARQHHPTWYKVIDCLSDDEFKLAMSSLVVSPMQWTFSIPSFTIIASMARWDIQTQSKENCARIIKISEIVFGRLYDIRISAIGINRVMQRETKVPDVCRFLKEKLLGADIGFPDAVDTQPQIFYRTEAGLFTKVYTVTPAIHAKNMVVIGHDNEQRIPDDGSVKFFEFKDKLHPFAEEAWESAEIFCKNVLDKFR